MPQDGAQLPGREGPQQSVSSPTKMHLIFVKLWAPQSSVRGVLDSIPMPTIILE